MPLLLEIISPKGTEDKEDDYGRQKCLLFSCVNRKNRKNRTMQDFLDNLGNHQHQKMLREIANDDITPKKSDKKVINDLYETGIGEDGLDYDVSQIHLAEF